MCSVNQRIVFLCDKICVVYVNGMRVAPIHDESYICSVTYMCSTLRCHDTCHTCDMNSYASNMINDMLSYIHDKSFSFFLHHIFTEWHLNQIKCSNSYKHLKLQCTWPFDHPL